MPENLIEEINAMTRAESLALTVRSMKGSTQFDHVVRGRDQFQKLITTLNRRGHTWSLDLINAVPVSKDAMCPK